MMNKKEIFIFSCQPIEALIKEVIDLIEKANFGIIQKKVIESYDLSELYQITHRNVCVLFLSENMLQDTFLFEQLNAIWTYIYKEHIPVLPIIIDSGLYIKRLPAGLSDLHMLNIKDVALTEKIYRFFLDNPATLKILPDIEYVSSCLENKMIWNCTVEQLFHYALGLLYGTGVEKNIKEALIILTCLIGNDAFDTNYVSLFIDQQSHKQTISELLDFSNELQKYLNNRMDSIQEIRDYRDIESVVEYSKLMQQCGKYLYGWNVDESLRKLKDIISDFSKRDYSLIADKWLLNYYWNRSLREADNGYLQKAIDCIFEMILRGEELEKIYDNREIQLCLFKCYSFLMLFYNKRRGIIEKQIEYKITDELLDNGTFKASYRKEVRSRFERDHLQFLFEKCELNCWRQIDLLFQGGGDYSLYLDILSEILNVGYLAVLFKVQAIENTISEWYISVIKYINNKIVDFSVKHQLQLLKTTSDLLGILRQRYIIRTKKVNLFEIAEYLESIFDLNSANFQKMGLDKSEIYTIYMDYYLECENVDKYDHYALKLYQLVSQRDYEKINVIKSVLYDIYNLILERLNKNAHSVVFNYVELGWSICKSYNPLPIELKEAYNFFEDAASQLDIK